MSAYLWSVHSCQAERVCGRTLFLQSCLPAKIDASSQADRNCNGCSHMTIKRRSSIFANSDQAVVVVVIIASGILDVNAHQNVCLKLGAVTDTILSSRCCGAAT